MAADDERPAGATGTSIAEDMRRRWPVTIIVLLMAVAAIGTYTYYHRKHQLAVGRCYEEKSIAELEMKDCTSSSQMMIVALPENPEGPAPCSYVPGATDMMDKRLTGAGEFRRVICLGPSGLDPAKSLNVVQPGQCVGTDGNMRQFVTLTGITDCSGGEVRKVASLLHGSVTLTKLTIDDVEVKDDDGHGCGKLDVGVWDTQYRARDAYDRGVCLEPVNGGTHR